MYEKDILVHFVAGFHGLELPDKLKDLLANGLGGVVLFSRNIQSAEQLKALTAEIKHYGGPEVIIAVDQEGGPVQRLRNIGTYIPSAAEVGKLDAGAATVIGTIIAKEVAAFGFNVDFAPVLDVMDPGGDAIIGERAFSENPMECATNGAKFITAMHAQSVAACGKHFPGHGSANADSHKALPRITKEYQELSNKDLVPFRSAAGVGLKMIMTAHCVYDAIDPDLPATFSPQVIQGLLRRGLGFDRVVISDDLEMKAIADNFSIEDSIKLGVEAGLDLWMFCSDVDRLIEAAGVLSTLYNNDPFIRSRMNESSKRIKILRDWLKKGENYRKKLYNTDIEELKKLHEEHLNALRI